MECAAYSLSKLNREAELVEALKTLLSIKTTDARKYLTLGYLFRLLQPAEAELCFKKAVELDPNYGKALNNYGYMLARRGEAAEALPYCERACKLERNSHYMDSLGYVYLLLGRLEEAQNLFEESLCLLPDNEEAQRHLEEVRSLTR